MNGGIWPLGMMFFYFLFKERLKKTSPSVLLCLLFHREGPRENKHLKKLWKFLHNLLIVYKSHVLKAMPTSCGRISRWNLRPRSWYFISLRKYKWLCSMSFRWKYMTFCSDSSRCGKPYCKKDEINSKKKTLYPFKDEAQTALFKDPVRTAL